MQNRAILQKAFVHWQLSNTIAMLPPERDVAFSVAVYVKLLV